jgi:BioD-like phosphotransacetylase family protein
MTTTTTATYVASIGESTGKTAVALALAREAAERGHDVGYMKPKGTRLRSAVGKTLDEDPLLARDLLDLDAEIEDLEPIVYSPTFVEGALRGTEDSASVRERVAEGYRTLANDRDLMIVEGGGDLATGSVVDLADWDVADLLDAEVILLAGYGEPRDVDAVLAAARQLGDRLRGVLFNSVAEGDFDRLTTDVVPFLESRGIEVLGVLPRERDLAGVSIAELADELGAQIVTEEAPVDGFVERFVVGAMSAEEALRSFRRTREAVLVTGGDRSDVQTAALEAPGIECLLLTGGLTPPSAVVGQAENRGIPVAVVRSDTITTIDRAEGVLRSGRVRRPEAIETMCGLLGDAVDLDALLAVDG